MALFVLRVSIAVHTAASFAYWIAQPRGFAFLSRGFVEHQLVVPALFALSAAGFAATLLKRPRPFWISVGGIAGFWIASTVAIAVLGTTRPAHLSWIALAGAVGLLILAYRRVPPEPKGLITGGGVAGLALAAGFWLCTWAPPASTRPLGTVLTPSPVPQGPRILESDGVKVTVTDRRVIITSGTEQAILWPAFEYPSVADGGLWTIFQFRSSAPPPWSAGTTGAGRLLMTAENDDFLCHARIWIQDRVVHVRCLTQVKRELASHLSSVMRLQLDGACTLEGQPWRQDHADHRSEFIAFREGRTQFLGASRREKGPFETLAAWEPRDPVLAIGGWKVQVLGWAEQGSREPSPTAGWGVSQAAIERAGSHYYWSLASTSIGRGWHTVRTAPGVYLIEAVLTPP